MPSQGRLCGQATGAALATARRERSEREEEEKRKVEERTKACSEENPFLGKLTGSGREGVLQSRRLETAAKATVQIKSKLKVERVSQVGFVYTAPGGLKPMAGIERKQAVTPQTCSALLRCTWKFREKRLSNNS